MKILVDENMPYAQTLFSELGEVKAIPGRPIPTQELIDEKYQGIRPAPGYPACPEHIVKHEMFRVLQCEDIEMFITDSYAMIPASSVSGFYFSHPLPAHEVEVLLRGELVTPAG